MDENDESVAALEEARAQHRRRRTRLNDAQACRAAAQRALAEAAGELERLDRIVDDVPRRERILASPLDFPDVDLTAVAAGLPAARAAAVEARQQLVLVEARRVAAADECDELWHRVRKFERKVEDSDKKIAAAQRRVDELVDAADLKRRRSRFNGVMIGLLAVGALIVGYYCLNWIMDIGERRPWRAVGVASALTVVSIGAIALVRYRDRADSLLAVKGAVPLFVWVAFFAGYPALTSFSAHQHGFLADYCNYGVVSKAQFEGCMHHASEATIESSNSHAARFARGELQDCLSDAGPFCAQALAYDDYADHAAP